MKFRSAEEKPEVTFTKTDRLPIPAARVPLFEYFLTRKGEAPWNAEGCRLRAGLVVARGYSADPFVVAAKIGTAWFEVVTVALDDPGIQSLRDSGHMITIGPSPSQVEKERRQELLRQEQIEAQEAYHRSRREFHRARLRQEAQMQRREIDKRRAEGC